MSIRNFIDVPDDQVPEWVRKRREERRAARAAERRRTCSCNQVFPHRGWLLNHCDATGHKPIVVETLDSCIKRP